MDFSIDGIAMYGKTWDCNWNDRVSGCTFSLVSVLSYYISILYLLLKWICMHHTSPASSRHSINSYHPFFSLVPFPFCWNCSVHWPPRAKPPVLLPVFQTNFSNLTAGSQKIKIESIVLGVSKNGWNWGSLISYKTEPIVQLFVLSVQLDKDQLWLTRVV